MGRSVATGAAQDEADGADEAREAASLMAVASRRRRRGKGKVCDNNIIVVMPLGLDIETAVFRTLPRRAEETGIHRSFGGAYLSFESMTIIVKRRTVPIDSKAMVSRYAEPSLSETKRW